MKGRVNQTSNFSIPVIGRISIGGKNEKGFPVSYDYFSVNTKYQQYHDAFVEAFGEKPNCIQITFMEDDISKVCSEVYEMRDSAEKIFAIKDDNQYIVYKDRKETIYEADAMAKKYGSLELFEKALADSAKSRKGFVLKLTLVFVIPKLKGIVGCWKFITYGANTSIRQIIESFDTVKDMAGTVRMVPFDLVVEKRSNSVSGSPVKYSTVNLVPSASFDSMKAIKEFASGEQFTLYNDDNIKKLQSGEGT